MLADRMRIASIKKLKPTLLFNQNLGNIFSSSSGGATSIEIGTDRILIIGDSTNAVGIAKLYQRVGNVYNLITSLNLIQGYIKAVHKVNDTTIFVVVYLDGYKGFLININNDVLSQTTSDTIAAAIYYQGYIKQTENTIFLFTYSSSHIYINCINITDTNWSNYATIHYYNTIDGVSLGLGSYIGGFFVQNNSKLVLLFIAYVDSTYKIYYKVLGNLNSTPTTLTAATYLSDVAFERSTVDTNPLLLFKIAGYDNYGVYMEVSNSMSNLYYSSYLFNSVNNTLTIIRNQVLLYTANNYETHSTRIINWKNNYFLLLTHNSSTGKIDFTVLQLVNGVFSVINPKDGILSDATTINGIYRTDSFSTDKLIAISYGSSTTAEILYYIQI